MAQLFNAVVQQVAISEASAAAAGAGRGLGAQKLALVVRSVEGSIAEYEKKNNLTTPLTQTQVEAVTNAVVAFLNALPANAAAEDIGTLTAPVPELHVFSIR